MATRLGHVDVDRHLAQPAFNHQGIEKFRMFEQEAGRMGFAHAACGPMVRSSYHADAQARQAGIAQG